MSKLTIKSKVAKELSKIKGRKGVYLLLSEPEYSHHANTEASLFITQKMKLNELYVTLSRSCNDIPKDFEEENIKNVFFIDGSGSLPAGQKENCTILKSNKSLTELSIAISREINKRQIDAFFIDSISTLLIYNNAETAEMFFHYMASRIRNMNKLLIANAINEEKSKKTIPIIAQFCDKVIRV